MKYYLKRIFIGVSIGLILSFLNGCEAKAEGTFLITPGTNYCVHRNVAYCTNWGLRNPYAGLIDVYVGNFTGNTSIGTILMEIQNPAPGKTISLNVTLVGNVNKINSFQIDGATCFAGTRANNDSGTMSFYCPNVHSPYATLDMFVSMDMTGIINGAMGYQRRANYTILDDVAAAINNQNTVINNNSNTINNSIKDTNNTLKDDSVDSSNTNSTLDNLNSNMPTSGTISSLILMPITLAQSYLNGLNSSCSTYSMGTVLGVNISLPCINLSDLLGASLISIIDVLFSGFMIFAIGKKMVRVFNDFTNLKDGQINDVFGGGSQ